jgi:hypothetical protein
MRAISEKFIVVYASVPVFASAGMLRQSSFGMAVVIKIPFVQ